jgi:hypothetical protein
MTNTAAPAATVLATVGDAKTIHIGYEIDGQLSGVECGSDRFRNYRSRFYRVTTPGAEVTCRKCRASDAPVPAPVAVEERVRCTNVVYGEPCGNLHLPSKGCAMCA